MRRPQRTVRERERDEKMETGVDNDPKEKKIEVNGCDHGDTR